MNRHDRADPLADYRSRLVSELHTELFQDLARWSTTSCACAAGPDRHIKQAYVAATFCAFCVPPHAAMRDSLIAARCCLLFFLVDDGPVDQLADFVRFLETGERADGNEPATCLRSVRQALHDLDCETRDVESAIYRWAASMRAEQRLDIGSLNPETYYELRQETIFVSCLTSCWLSLLRIEIPERWSADCAAMFDRSTRLVILANDLGSLRADATGGPGTLIDINTVLQRSVILGSHDHAVGEAVDSYNARVAEFCAQERDLLGADAPLAPLLAVVRAVTNGNLEGTRHLVAERYPGSAETLRRLKLV